MAGLDKKVIGGKPYWYLREMAWMAGKPKLVSERYLGSAAEIEALLDAREQAALPQRTAHLALGDVAAVWGMRTRFAVPGVLDSVLGPRRSDAGASTGTYLVLVALNRVVAPARNGHSRTGDAAPPLTGSPKSRPGCWIVEEFEVDIAPLALDRTTFVTFLDTGNTRHRSRRGARATQKRADLRLAGLGLVVSRGGGIPLVSHAEPGNKPDLTQFPTVLDLLAARHATPAGYTSSDTPVERTVVFDAGQNSAAHFAHWPRPAGTMSGQCRPRTCPICRPCPRHDAGPGTPSASG